MPDPAPLIAHDSSVVEHSLEHALTSAARAGVHKLLSDAEYANALADYLHATTGVKPAYAKLVIALLAPLARAGGSAAGGWISGLVGERLKRRLKQVPGVQRVLDALDGAITKISADAAAKREFTAMLDERRAGRGPAFEGEGDLSRELRAHVETLATLDDLSTSVTDVRALCDALLAQLPPQPVLRAALLPRDTHLHRFVYRARRAALRGRDAELAQLETFVDTSATFAWWALTGPGGLGKSRLALELGIRIGAAARVGWFDPTTTFDWDRWQPDRPTVIIADYADAGSNADAVFQLLRRLSSRNDLGLPVRVLLLARAEARTTDPRNWYARLTTAGSNASLIEAKQFAPPDVLGGLDDNALWSVVEAFLPSGSDVPDRPAVLANLLTIDPARRPLFAAMVGDALGAGRSLRAWDQARLVSDVLNRERRQFWYRAETPSPDEVRHEHLLAVATLAGGVPVVDLDAGARDAPGLVPDAATFDPEQYTRMVVAPATERLAPLEPDILGEFMVLDVLHPRHAADDRGIRLLSAAVGAGSRTTWDTFVRIGQDFPKHETVAWLTERPRGTHDGAVEEYAGTCRALANGMREGGHQSDLATLYERIDRLSDAPHPDGRPHDPALVHAFWFVTFCYAWALGAAGNLPSALPLAARLARDLRENTARLAQDREANPDLQVNPAQEELRLLVSGLAADLTVDWSNAIRRGPGGEVRADVGPHAAQELVSIARLARDLWPEDVAVREAFARTARQVASVAGDRGWFTVARMSYVMLRDVARTYTKDQAVQQRLARAAHDLMIDIEQSEVRDPRPTPAMIDRVEELLADCAAAYACFRDDPDMAGQLGRVAQIAARYLASVGRSAGAQRAAKLAEVHATAAQRVVRQSPNQ